MTSREMLSVGIDVGTTTTQVVLSQLSVNNQARMGLVPGSTLTRGGSCTRARLTSPRS